MTAGHKSAFSVANQPEIQESELSAVEMLARSVEQAHFKLIWMAIESPVTRSDFLSHLAARFGCPLLGVGKLLSSALLDQPAPLRPASAENAFYDMLHQSGAEMMCLDHLEILFDQSLMLKAVDLIRNASRRFVLIAAWPGTVDATGLSFGPADHPSHFRISFSEMECPVYQISTS